MTLQALAESLEMTHSHYSALIELGLQKKEHILHHRLNELASVISKETKLLKQIDACEQIRNKAVLELQKEFGLSAASPLTLAEICKHLSRSADKQMIEDWMKRLSEKAKELKSLNELNQSLVQQDLDFVNLSLDLLTGVPEKAVYQAPSPFAQTAPTHGFNRNFDLKA
jgi:flagellar biosynthesis/type III secretory pathway chaperone